MADDFNKSVEDGLKLAKRLYFGKDRSVTPPKPVAMDKESKSYLPTAPMVYAVISDPSIVDNPDIPSYQPHVYGRCDRPALIPLQMNGIALQVDCYLETVLITVSGSWRVHCVMGSRSCDCRLAVPMGEQGSILGVEVDVPRKSYCTQLITMEEIKDNEKVSRGGNGGLLKPHIFTLTIPQIDGGSNISIKIRWSQKLLYNDGQLKMIIPFRFPGYVTPAGKKLSKKEKIRLNVNCGTGMEVLCKTSSHPLKEIQRQVGKLVLSYEAEVLTWSTIDFHFSFSVPSSHIHGGVLLQSPSVHDVDQREMFCLYLFPGDHQSKVFRKEVVFIVDISGSMQGRLLEDTKNAVSVALSKLDPRDSFNIIAFNGEILIFSSSVLLATEEAIENAIQWMNTNFIAGGDTNILLPLNKAMELFSRSPGFIPIIFLITDGSVEDERHICDVMKNHLTNEESIHPRIYTFGIGLYCNHYFLKMLAMLGRGYHDAAYDTDLIEPRMERLFTWASSTALANITIDALEDLDDIEVYPSRMPDLLAESVWTVSGRYRGDFPNTIQARGISEDLNKFVTDLKVHKAKEIPLDMVIAQQQIGWLTVQAWFSENKQLEEKIAEMSRQAGVISEYTQMILLESEGGTQSSEFNRVQEPLKLMEFQRPVVVDPKVLKIMLLQNLGLGFGDVNATAENWSPGEEEPKLPEAAEIFVKATTNCCAKICGFCCCPCCIRLCGRLNDQCAIALTQLCGALAFLGCFSCIDFCCSGQDGG